MGKMLRIGICEDEKQLLQFFEETIRRWLSEKHIAHEIVTASNGEALLSEEQVLDIVFLDVAFANSKMNGIAIGKMLRKRSKQTKIIFVTGYPEYQIEAMDVHYFYYLLKPVTEAKICRQLQEAIEYTEDVPIILPFETEAGIVRIYLEEIYYLFYFSHNRIRIITEQKEYVVRGTMKNMSEKLAAYSFFLIHQAYLVNLQQVKRPYAKKAVLLNNTELTVADRRSSAFRKAFYEYLYRTTGKR